MQPKKAAQSIESSLAKKPERLAKIVAKTKASLRDATAVNATHQALANRFADTAFPTDLSSGGRTKFNRAQLGIPKTHAFDAACVGEVYSLIGWRRPILHIQCCGRGA